jgi:hypothetical protein
MVSIIFNQPSSHQLRFIPEFMAVAHPPALQDIRKKPFFFWFFPVEKKRSCYFEIM